nr:PRC-barrel domain-containing protein [Devosia chinhatensis]
MQPSELTAHVLEGAPIYDARDRQVGRISHVHGSGSLAEVIVDVGGFFGLGAKPVAIPVSGLDFMRDHSGRVHALTLLDEEQLKALPEHRHN